MLSPPCHNADIDIFFDLIYIHAIFHLMIDIAKDRIVPASSLT